MKPITITAASLAEQLKTAEAQVFLWRARRAKLQEDLADLRDEMQVEMRRALTLPGGTSPEVKALRAKIAEGETTVDQADGMIADADRLVIALHAQVAAARTEEEKATHVAEVVRRSSIAGARIAELKAALEAASKVAGQVAIAIGELERIDKLAATPFFAAARALNPGAALVQQGWKLGEFIAWGELKWEVFPAVPPVPGLEQHPLVNLPGYLKARDAAAQVAPGARQ
jgi:hypothetical protein